MPGRDKVRAGQKIAPRAAFWNQVVDLVERDKVQQLGRGGRPRPPKPLAPNCLKVKNSSGGNLVAGSVIQVADYLPAAIDKAALWFDAITPSNAGAVHAILRLALPENEFGEAQFLGACIAKVNVNDVEHTCCLVKASQAELESSPIGPHRLIHAPGTGSQLCVVILGGGILGAHCVCDEESGIAQDATGTITIGGKSVEAENHSGITLEDEKRGWAYIESGKVFVWGMECSS